MRDLAADLDLALALADRADEMTMAAYTGDPVAHTTKPDGSPVTEVDGAVEVALRQMVADARPGDGFVGEETGATPAVATDRRWIIDPIDGTRAFAAGRVEWGTLIALEEDGRLVLGVASMPAAGQRCWGAVGLGGRRLRRGDAAPHELRVDDRCEALADARWTSNPGVPSLEGPAVEFARSTGSPERYVHARDWTSYPALMVADGSLDVALQLHGEPWDYAALVAIVEAAGGAFAHVGPPPSLAGTRPGVFTTPSLLAPAVAALAAGAAAVG